MRHGRRRETSAIRSTPALGLTLAVLLLAPSAASASTITVDSPLDTTGGGICTLRDAINAANANSVFGTCPAGQGSPTVDIINFSLPNPSTIMLAGALPDISSDIAITGPGSGQLTVSGQDAVRPFNALSTHTDSISGVTIAHGLCDDACGSGGGAIQNAATLTLTNVTVTSSNTTDTVGLNSFPEGGGIENRSAGTLHLILSVVSANSSIAGGVTSATAPDGGGIANSGVLTLDRSTVSGNAATATADPGATTNAFGGGIAHTGGSLTIRQSTISGNSATATGATGNGARGGAISMGNTTNITLSLDRATVTGNLVSAGAPVGGSQSGGGISASGGAGSAFTVVSSTISGNTAPTAANVDIGSAAPSIKNSIVSHPTGGDNCNSTDSGSLGFNIEDTNSCGFTQAGDQHGVNPMLGVLSPNGGPTQTMALLTGSPAIDAGLSSVGELADQRGMTRPLDLAAVSNAPGSDGTDIGAFEVQGLAVTPPPAGNPTPPLASAPDTSLSAHIRKRKRKATFIFGSDKPGSSFMCKLDKRAFSPCTSPITYKHLRKGKHAFAVEAVDSSGNVDPTPATRRFKLKR